MIGRLRGILIEKQPQQSQLLIDISGIAYEVNAPMSTFYHLPDRQQEVQLFTHLVVREDAQILYGFYEERERRLFRTLIKVNGVGPKVALSILSGIEPDQFVLCVRDDDASRLTGIPGIGKKTAERLIVELRNSLAQWESDQTSASTTKGDNGNHSFQEAISALTTLGYKPNEAKRTITQIYKSSYSSEELIRLALQQMVAT